MKKTGSECVKKLDLERFKESDMASFRIRDPSLFTSEIAIPPYGRDIAGSIAPGAYVVTGRLKTGEWKPQAIRVPVGKKSEKRLWQEAKKIAIKIKACEGNVKTGYAGSRRGR